jgi:hypothetical protein
MPVGTRMNGGSSKASRRRRRAMPTAGWLIPSRRAARLTLSSFYNAKAIGSRFKSGFFVVTRRILPEAWLVVDEKSTQGYPISSESNCGTR